MSGINPNLLYSVVRVRTRFVDDIGNAPTGVGTGFWLRTTEEEHVLVTNRHVVDPVMVAARLGLRPSLRRTELAIELRLAAGAAANPSEFRRVLRPDTTFARVTNADASLLCAPAADCAIVVRPELEVELHGGGEFRSLPILREADLADEAWFATRIDVHDDLFFVGFPGKEWWDTTWNLPIARRAIIASAPWLPFSNEAVRTPDTLLVSGFSFGGSSGSPLLSSERGIGPGGGINDPYWNPPKLLGIMSGHINEPVPLPSLIDHTGLSYATRSTSILALLATWRARLRG